MKSRFAFFFCPSTTPFLTIGWLIPVHPPGQLTQRKDSNTRLQQQKDSTRRATIIELCEVTKKNLIYNWKMNYTNLTPSRMEMFAFSSSATQDIISQLLCVAFRVKDKANQISVHAFSRIVCICRKSGPNWNEPQKKSSWCMHLPLAVATDGKG